MSTVQGSASTVTERLGRLRAFGFITYEQYLRSEIWLARRSRALQASGGVCFCCEDTDQLDVHHSTYQRLCEERPEDLVVLCRYCHRAAHQLPGDPATAHLRLRDRMRGPQDHQPPRQAIQ